MVVDQEKGFSQGLLSERLQAEGTQVILSSARSPRQAGKTERAGGYWKGMFSKISQETPLSDETDFEEAVEATTVAVNEAIRRGRYGVYARVFGRGL